MSAVPAEATPSPIPRRPNAQAPPPQKPVPKPHPRLPILKKLRFQCNDLGHTGAGQFFQNTDPSFDLREAVDTVLSILYEPSATNDHIPPVRSVTLVLEDMGGVAYTKGMDLDNDHKEIHLCLSYISSIQREDEDKVRREILGVIVHEMVHCWQWNGKGTCPGGLIEGIADFVRLKAGLGADHWKEKKGEKWDAGYQHTAYFLDWIERSKGAGSIRRMNGALQHEKYDEAKFWKDLFGQGVDEMWTKYQESVDDDQGEEHTRHRTATSSPKHQSLICKEEGSYTATPSFNS